MDVFFHRTARISAQDLIFHASRDHIGKTMQYHSSDQSTYRWHSLACPDPFAIDLALTSSLRVEGQGLVPWRLRLHVPLSRIPGLLFVDCLLTGNLYDSPSVVTAMPLQASHREAGLYSLIGPGMDVRPRLFRYVVWMNVIHPFRQLLTRDIRVLASGDRNGCTNNGISSLFRFYFSY